MSFRAVMFLLVASAVFTPARARAQAPEPGDTARAPRWSAEFEYGAAFRGIGIVRHVSPSAALVFNGGFEIGRDRTSFSVVYSQSEPEFPTDYYRHSAFTTRAGLRFSPSPRSRARWVNTAGAAWSHTRLSSAGQKYTSWGLGVFDALGLSYRATDRMTVGASVTAQSFSARSSDGIRSWHFSVSGPSAIIAIAF